MVMIWILFWTCNVGEGPDKFAETDNRLSGRLFATDMYPNSRLNLYSKPDLLTFVLDAQEGTPEFDTIRQSPLGVLLDLPVSRCPISCKLIHALLSRQLVTKKKYELWMIFGGQPLCFSLTEFKEMSGLPCGEFTEGYDPDREPVIKVKKDPVFQKIICGDKHTTLGDLGKLLKNDKDMPSWRKLALALIIIVDGVLVGKFLVNRPTPKYVRMLDDIDAFLSFPWGWESFLKTVATMRPQKMIYVNCPDPVAAFCLQLQQHSIRLQVFPLVLQLLAYRSIPSLLNKVPNEYDEQPLMDASFVGSLN